MSDSPLRRRLAQAQRRNSGKPAFLPDGCPVTPLGGDGRQFHYLNAIHQLVVLGAQEHSKNNITALFSPFVESWCHEHYPKTRDKNTDRPLDYKVDWLVRDLMAEAQSRGVSWEPTDSIHGRGIWPGQDGDLRVHLGARLIVGGQPSPPGVIGQKVYPLRPEWQGPAPDAQAPGPAGPAAELLALLGCWNWAEAELAPRLLLGWVMAGWLCGALPWRPHLWVVAPRGSGKSTLLDLIGHLMQQGRFLLKAENATAAAIRAKLEYDARPVCLDETEPSEDNRGLNAMLEVLRHASSGGKAMRANVEQGVVEQTLRFNAICASVVRPALKSQDASRITALRLLKPRQGAAKPLLRAEVLELLGRRLLRRALDGWKRWPEVLHAWDAALAAQGCDPRTRDQFAVLLALAWIAEHDEAPDTDSLEQWCTLTVEATHADRAEERPEWFRLIETLATTTLRDEQGRHEASIAELLETASFARRKPDTENGGWTLITPQEAERAQQVLKRNGIAFDPALDAHGRPLRRAWHDLAAPATSQGDGPIEGHVAIANAHPALARILERTQWAARPGAPGAWRGVLMDVDGACVAAAARFGPRTSRAVRVPLRFFFDGGGEHE